MVSVLQLTEDKPDFANADGLWVSRQVNATESLPVEAAQSLRVTESMVMAPIHADLAGMSDMLAVRPGLPT